MLSFLKRLSLKKGEGLAGDASAQMVVCFC